MRMLRIIAAIFLLAALVCTIIFDGVIENIALFVLATILIINLIINAVDYRNRFMKK